MKLSRKAKEELKHQLIVLAFIAAMSLVVISTGMKIAQNWNTTTSMIEEAMR